jgi:6-phosphogluconolactonase
MAPTPRLLVHALEPLAAAAAARDIARVLRDAVAARGVAHVAFSGGSSAPPMLAVLASQRHLPWRLVHVYQVDERVAPDGDAARNATALRDSLLEAVPLPEDNVHLMDVTAEDLAAAAAAYAGALPRLDVVHLGIGPDGHTASWPPGDPVLLATAPVAVVGPFNGHVRMTITPPVVADARSVVVLATGESKREPLARMLAGDPATPASHVPFARTTIHTDRAAMVQATGNVRRSRRKG